MLWEGSAASFRSPPNATLIQTARMRTSIMNTTCMCLPDFSSVQNERDVKDTMRYNE